MAHPATGCPSGDRPRAGPDASCCCEGTGAGNTRISDRSDSASPCGSGGALGGDGGGLCNGCRTPLDCAGLVIPPSSMSNSENLGRFFGSLSTQTVIICQTSSGHPPSMCVRDGLPPPSTCDTKSFSRTSKYGILPSDHTSHVVMPNAQTSVFSENLLYWSTSSACQRIGRASPSAPTAYVWLYCLRSVSPKSPTLTLVALTSSCLNAKRRQLRAARSRWMNFISARCSIPWQICREITRLCAGDSFPSSCSNASDRVVVCVYYKYKYCKWWTLGAPGRATGI
jgi:hypothetical protein